MFLVTFLFGRVFGRLITLALVLLVAGGAGWYFFIREDNKLATAAPAIPASVKGDATAAAGSNPASTTGANVFKIIPAQSEAAYFAGETLARVGLPSTAKGVTKDIEGQFALTADGLDTAKTTKFTVKLTSLKSNESQRDSRAQGALETSKFAVATFTATKLSGLPKEFPAATEVPLQLTGTLDLHGVQKEVTWDVKAKKEGAGFSAPATVRFKFADFNINRPNLAGFVTVDEDVTLQVQIIAQAS